MPVKKEGSISSFIGFSTFSILTSLCPAGAVQVTTKGTAQLCKKLREMEVLRKRGRGRLYADNNEKQPQNSQG